MRMATVLWLLAVGASGCSHAPPRVVTVDVQAWVDAQPPGSVSVVLDDRHALVRAKLEPLVHGRGFNLALDAGQVAWSAPDLDLTPVLLGHTDAHVPLGAHIGRVRLQAALLQTRAGREAQARLKELAAKQRELDDALAALQRQYPSDGKAALRQRPEAQALLQRFAALREDLEALESQLTRTLVQALMRSAGVVAKRHGFDIIVDASSGGRDLIYRRGTRYPPDAPDVTDELVRQSDAQMAP